MFSSRAARLTSIAVVVLVIAVALSVVACRKSETPTTGLGSTPVNSGSVAVSATAGLDGDSLQKAETTFVPAPRGGEAQGDGSTGGSSGGAAGVKEEPKPGVVVAADKGAPIKIMWWNDTVDRSADKFELVYADQSFQPDAKRARATGSIGPCPYDTTVTLVVYPDGRDGAKFVVPFTVTKVMQGNSERDAIHVQISDGSVRVLGNAVDNFEQTFKR